MGNYKIVATEREGGYFELIYADIGLEHCGLLQNCAKKKKEGALLRDATIGKNWPSCKIVPTEKKNGLFKGATIKVNQIIQA